MAQGPLPFQYEVEKKSTGMTALAGLPLYVEFFHVTGLRGLIAKHVNVHGRTQLIFTHNRRCWTRVGLGDVGRQREP